MKHYPIQLLNVFVDQLEIIVHDRYRFTDDNYAKTFDYTVYSTDYDESNAIIGVKVELSIKPESTEPEQLDRPFSLLVAVAGQFKVDAEQFPTHLLQDWAVNNAPIVLLPFIREHAYSLSARAGFNPVLLPLVEVPTVRLGTDSKRTEGTES